jgi:hypothetical protein
MAVGWIEVTDSAAQLRTATRRAKSDVANKLISMFLHELIRKISQSWRVKVESEEYEQLVRSRFDDRCPYCSRDLSNVSAVVEHLDGMNRYRAGLHVPGNVLVACKQCNGEKRRDHSLRVLTLANFGCESFLPHKGDRCADSCRTCRYWKSIWAEERERRTRLTEKLERIRAFRSAFPEFERALPFLMSSLPTLLTKLYSDCQSFADVEIRSLMERFEKISAEAARVGMVWKHV